ncbi:hypothetical protein BDQ17DRAFT_1342742 [Cyathus striatus]|nr:hypothetical protein BDQ17DRAFT_1342742 [Cyathus striatus]
MTDPPFATLEPGLYGFATIYDAKDLVVKNIKTFPFYVTCASLLVLSLQIAYYATRKGKSAMPKNAQLEQEVKARERSIVWFNGARFLGCIVLFALSNVTTIRQTGNNKNVIQRWGLPITFLYASLLSAASLLSRQWSFVTTGHLDLVLFVPFGVYSYRDFWPLITTTETPKDIAEGPLLWAKLAVLSFVTVVVPLFIPRRYTPVDPSDPMPEPSPDLTASVFSKYLYFYLDTLIFKAAKVEHLSLNELPPLSDRDRSRYLKGKAFRHLDPFSGAKQRHLFFKLLRVFRKEYAMIYLNILIQVIANFGAPIGINRVLSYLEFGPGSSTIRPWFWVIWIFVGPMAFSISRQSYIFMNTRVIVRIESLVTQLVFEHSLRIRVKAETSGAELATDASQSEDTGTQGEVQQVAKKEVPRTDNLVGKLNNLVTSDMSSLYGAKDFLLVVLYVPLQIAAGIFFLYKSLDGTLSKEKMKLTDARVQSVTETVNVLRMVKMFAWESKMSDNITKGERTSCAYYSSPNQMIISLVMMTTYGFYTMVMKEKLSASIVYSSMPMFDLMNSQLHLLSTHTLMLVRGKVALDRLSGFLKDTELLDEYTSTHKQPQNESDIFSWSNEDGTSTPSFRLRIEGELAFKKGCVAYATQESWVLNDTIRNNILFGSAFDETRYNKVLQQCALKQDLDLFDAGDLTEVGERGLTLRITLARAVYSLADILLLDDILAALDAHTSRWIVEECLLGDLIKGRTVLLVTHNVPLTKPVAHFIVWIGIDGLLTTETLTPMDHLPKNLPGDIEDIMDNDVPKKRRLILAEEILKGRVGWKPIKFFVSSLGGKQPIIFFSIWISVAILLEVMHSGNLWYVGFWGSRYDENPNVQSSFYVGIYALLVISSSAIGSAQSMYYMFGTMRASQIVNSVLMGSILGSTFRWLDETPMSRIITRCTQDMGIVDNFIGPLALAVVIKLVCVAIVTPVFVVPGMVIALLGFMFQLPVRREKSNVTAPVLAHFGATVSGLVSVRAYGAQQALKDELQRRIDNYSRAARMSFDLNRWLTVRTDFTGALFTASLALYLVLTRSASAAITGFALALALDFCHLILILVTLYNEFEVQANSLERIQSYLEIDHEKPSTEAGKPPAAWPMSGDLSVESLSARYSANSPEILHQISFQIRSGERVGVVGRTGSGKSTLALALLRCIPTEGHVYYDGVAADKINLDALRSNITIIPQAPELLSGTLRRNLDPFEEHDDAELNSALKHAGLFSLQSESDDEVRITLDTKIASGGSNLSVGQRQIIALARAMVRESKVLILDEDYKTDSLIQDALRTKLNPDVTVITIAHRLQTIMDADKIMVLDAGNLVEFDTPKALLQKEGGIFKGLVDKSGDGAALRDAAFAKAPK